MPLVFSYPTSPSFPPGQWLLQPTAQYSQKLQMPEDIDSQSAVSCGSSWSASSKRSSSSTSTCVAPNMVQALEAERWKSAEAEQALKVKEDDLLRLRSQLDAVKKAFEADLMMQRQLHEDELMKEGALRKALSEVLKEKLRENEETKRKLREAQMVKDQLQDQLVSLKSDFEERANGMHREWQATKRMEDQLWEQLGAMRGDLEALTVERSNDLRYNKELSEQLELQKKVSDDACKELELLHRIKEVLMEEGTCPVKMELIGTPMLAPDGFSYERNSILRWLRENPSSPVTRKPMRQDQLLPNRALAKLLELLRPTTLRDRDEYQDTGDGSDPEPAPEVSAGEVTLSLEDAWLRMQRAANALAAHRPRAQQEPVLPSRQEPASQGERQPTPSMHEDMGERAPMRWDRFRHR